jgi:hypothetical protein
MRWIHQKAGCRLIAIIQKQFLYISHKYEINVGDKVGGRHGNKGTVSKILCRHDICGLFARWKNYLGYCIKGG